MPFQKRYLLVFACMVVAFLFTTCKKYPKNILWCKNPSKVIARDSNNPWLLDYYSVNDIDSTDSFFLEVWKKEGIVISPKPDGSFNCPDILFGYWSFFDRKKVVVFAFANESFHTTSGSNPNYLNQRNIFMKSGLRYEIRKLSKDQFWVITEYNNFKYEIHFK